MALYTVPSIHDAGSLFASNVVKDSPTSVVKNCYETWQKYLVKPRNNSQVLLKA